MSNSTHNFPLAQDLCSAEATCYAIEKLVHNKIYLEGTVYADELNHVKEIISTMLKGKDIDGFMEGVDGKKWCLNASTDLASDMNAIFMVYDMSNGNKYPVAFFHAGRWFLS